MTKYTALILIIALRIFFHPSNANTSIAPFASLTPLPTSTISITPAKFIDIDGKISNDKIKLTWNISENETAYKFEVEKSTDGRHFTLAALVFGTDKKNTDQYQFYEKAGSTRVIYRVKVVNKNKETEYSRTIQIDPAV